MMQRSHAFEAFVARACRARPALGVGARAAPRRRRTAIEAFNVAQQGGKVIVQITSRSRWPAPPASFTVTNPPRIAFDFPDTANALGRNARTSARATCAA